jgi:putative membrane protein
MTDQTASSVPRVDTTRLALERTRVAYERTMMAWVRTGTSLITFGFSVYKFFQIEMKDSIVAQTFIGPRGFGLALIGIGLLSLLLGTIEHARDLTSLRRQYDHMPRSTSKFVAIVIAVLGLFSLTAVVLHA